MIPAAATLATLAREAAEAVFDGLTTDCTEPMRLERMTTMPKYTTELVPTMPLPHAAPAPAAEAGLTALDVRAMDRYAESCQPHDVRALAADWLALAAERDRLSAELAALRGAMPDPALLDYAAGQLSVASRNVHIASSTADQYRDTEESLASAAARIRALATATPPAAEAGTGGGASAWGTEAPTVSGRYWVIMPSVDPHPTLSRFDIGTPSRIVIGGVSFGRDPRMLWGPRVEPPTGWQAALDTLQEADHAR